MGVWGADLRSVVTLGQVWTVTAESRSDRRRLCVVGGVVERDDSLLMVRQQGPGDPEGGFWVIPGGVVETGETLEQALKRELLEGTGLQVERPGRLLWIVAFGQSVTFVFSVHCEYAALPGGQDPDALVEEAAWVPRSEALRRLAALPFPRMGKPAVAVLSRQAPVGSVWTYVADGTGDDQLLSVIPNS